MTIESDRISTLLGFAFRSGKVVVGTDAIVKSKMNFVVYYDQGISENSLKKIGKINRAKKAIDLVCLNGLLWPEFLRLKSIKAIGVIDSNINSELLKLIK